MKNFFLLLLIIPTLILSQDILPLRERAGLIEKIQKERIQKLLPHSYGRTRY